MGFLSDLAAVGAFGVGVASMFMGDDETEGERLARQAAEERKQIMEALNPNSAEGRAMIDAEEGQIRSDFAESVRQLIAQNNRATARGKAGVFLNPERRDETVSRMFIRNNDESRNQAQQKVQNQLLQRLNANGASIGAYGQLGQAEAARSAGNRQRMASGLEAIFTGMSALDNRMAKPNTQYGYTAPPGTQAVSQQTHPWLYNAPQIYSTAGVP